MITKADPSIPAGSGAYGKPMIFIKNDRPRLEKLLALFKILLQYFRMLLIDLYDQLTK